ncbi:putative SH3 domain-containing protein [Helianthus annuus]|nr:putative SH3 domain-containing protein [Helianthus annuus]
MEPESFDDDLVNAWASGLADDGLWGNNTPAMNRVNEFLSGSGTDAPDVDDENIFAKSSNDDMWAKTLLEPSELDDDESSSSSSPGSVGSVETSASSHFGGMNYPSLFSSKSQPKIREEPPPYSSPLRKRYESLENPLAGTESEYNYNDEGRSSSGNMEFGTALYDFTAGGDDEMSLVTGEELEIEYEVDGWFYVKKVSPGWDGKIAGLVPVLYVSRS